MREVPATGGAGVRRKLAAILYADVDGYSRLTGADEEGTHQALNASLDLITGAIEAHGGRVVHFAGDAVLAEFASVVGSVSCAVAAQRELRARTRDLPDDRKLRFRIGINLGEVIVDRNDIYGDGVNIAARLESVAEAGGIAVSRAIYEQARKSVDLVFDDMGKHAVKNIAEPVHVYRLRVDPEDAPVARIRTPSSLLWRGVALGVCAILGLEAAAYGAWRTLFGRPSAIERFLGSTTEGAARLALKPLPRELASGTAFRECGDCPEMVVVPAGTFVLGSSEGESGHRSDEGPAHPVTIARPFAVARYEVTYEQWDACVAARGCDYVPQDRGWGRGNRPVIYVNWHDAEQYLRWLRGLTGHLYRLPSEAEWEYAVRAGSRSAYWWGDEIGVNRANCKGCGNADGTTTSPVGSFAANAFGLYDVHGNVWEWTADCWHGTYAGAPAEAEPWTSPECPARVVRGGAWGLEPEDLRAARRVGDEPALRSGKRGFRPAMTVP